MPGLHACARLETHTFASAFFGQHGAAREHDASPIAGAAGDPSSFFATLT
jgi:hypothetical protein